MKRAVNDVAMTRRRRAADAMGLGPLWTLRGPALAEPEDEASRAIRIGSMNREELAAAVAACRACRLGATRVRAVFGDGPESAELLLLGSAPDAGDDADGMAFSGPAGRLLDAMTMSIAVDRGTRAFSTHLVKCRPPGDRAPTDDELAACRPFLERQVELVGPRFVVALGRSVADVAEARWSDDDLAVIPDPAAILVDPERKAEAWAALCDLKRRLELVPAQ